MGAYFVSTTARADEVKVSGVHNCCGACCKLIHEVLGKVEGVTEVSAKPKERDFTFDAANAKAARQAIGALARAGFHGKTNKEKLVFRDNSGVEAGKVTIVNATSPSMRPSSTPVTTTALGN